jgi:hypothetical protein
MASLREIAADVKAAKTAGGGNYIKPGKGVLIVREIKLQKGFKGKSFIAEFLVESSQATDAGKEPNSPGSSCSKIEMLTGKQEHVDSALGRIKALLIACSGFAEAALTADEMNAAFDEALDHPESVIGTRVGYETYQVVTRDTQKEITAVKWIPIPGQTAEMEADGRRKLTAVPVAEEVAE